MPATTIQEVIDQLDRIIEASRSSESPLGYFAALYRRVTFEVQQKLGTGYFDDDVRMEKLDVVFANRYLSAYQDYQAGKIVTHSWKRAFDLSTQEELIVLQHLLLGMNAHINLDLGIAAAQVSTPDTIHYLQSDFNRINDILASLVTEVQERLVIIWPGLFRLLRFAQQVDDFMVDAGLQAFRDKAWELAVELATLPATGRRSLSRIRMYS